MTDNATPEVPPSDRDAGAAGTESPGRLIRQARERAQLSLDELAAQTKLARNTLDALERDDFKILREPVYVHGYYRKCAKVLGLPEDVLIAGYKRLAGVTAPSAPSKLLLVSDNELFVSARGGSMRGWATLVIAVLVLVAIYVYLHSRGPVLPVPPPATSSSAEQAATTPAAAGPGLAVTATPLPGSASSVPLPAVAGSASTPSGSAATQAESTAAATESSTPSAAPPVPAAESAQSSAPPAAATLTLTFRDTSWVRVEDHDGKMLLSGVIQSGEKQVLKGTPPYAVFLGNAPGVRVDYDGKPVDTQPYLKPNSTARFTVPQG